MVYCWQPKRAARVEEIQPYQEQNHQKWWKLVLYCADRADTFEYSYFPGDPEEDPPNHSVFTTKYGLKVVRLHATQTTEEGNVMTCRGPVSPEMIRQMSALPPYYYFPQSPVWKLCLFRGEETVFSSFDFGSSSVSLNIAENDISKLVQMHGFD